MVSVFAPTVSHHPLPWPPTYYPNSSIFGCEEDIGVDDASVVTIGDKVETVKVSASVPGGCSNTKNPDVRTICSWTEAEDKIKANAFWSKVPGVLGAA